VAGDLANDIGVDPPVQVEPEYCDSPYFPTSCLSPHSGLYHETPLRTIDEDVEIEESIGIFGPARRAKLADRILLGGLIGAGLAISASILAAIAVFRRFFGVKEDTMDGQAGSEVSLGPAHE
jgi:hypothetical protein